MQFVSLECPLSLRTSLTPNFYFDVYILVHEFIQLGELVLVVTLLTHDKFVVEWLLVHDRILILALIFPARYV